MILCCGESLIDLVPDGDRYHARPGGGAFNTAVALGRLGAAAGYLWPLSTDSFGATLRGVLDEAGVDTRLCPQTDRPTALAVVTLRGGEASYGFYEDGTAARVLDRDHLPELPAQMRALVIGGISLIDPGTGAAIEELARRAYHTGRMVMLDPNIRPALIADPDMLRDRMSRLLRLAHIVKLSSDDLEWLMPGATPAEAAQRVIRKGASLMCHTHGASGATAYRWKTSVHAKAQTAQVADTIGAGDTFNAGFLAGLAEAGVLTVEGLRQAATPVLQAALALGTRAAAVTVSRPGADPPWRDELGLP
ncbi:carbohydrate kinase family protein [Paracoccus jeotgali]|uniref:Carbohydrate kinase n=1 Tax=Paracoccus jeotgali TaxID=2065379 RepID=A0A2K9MG05_9RHOB|nr:carbohydrate kinase [Paracoccus jeotgali]AUM73445.1 carbohydrate kinase [Paracoccus jeotgali]